MKLKISAMKTGVKKEETKGKYEKLDKKERNVSRKNSKILIAILITIVVLGAGFFVFNNFFIEKPTDIKEDDSLVLDLNLENALSIKDDSTYVTDSSKYGNDGTLKGDANIVDTDFGKAIEFNGGGYVEINDDDSLDISDEITISAWIKHYDSEKTVHSIVSKGSETGSNEKDLDWAYYFTLIDNHLRFTLFDDENFNWTEDTHQLISDIEIEQNKWYHVAGTYDGKTIEIYIDGKQVEEYFSTRNIPWEGNIRTNDRPMLVGGIEYFEEDAFVGKINNLKIYNRALTADEIQMNYYEDVQKYNLIS